MDSIVCAMQPLFMKGSCVYTHTKTHRHTPLVQIDDSTIIIILNIEPKGGGGGVAKGVRVRALPRHSGGKMQENT